MRLGDLATIKTNFQEADFWLIRRGAASQCGKPVKVFNPEHIGIKVDRTDILLPDYLYYVFMHIHNTKYWEPLANGTLTLVNIRVRDVRNIELSPR